MEIRKSRSENEAAIIGILASAKEYIITHGNEPQWTDGYPAKDF